MSVDICVIEGRIEQVMQNEQTKSEGLYSYLVDGDERRYRLFRDGEAEMGDPYFDPFASQQVRIEGEIVGEEWLQVKSIEIINIE